MSEINEIKNVFDELVQGAATITLNDKENALYDVTIDLLFDEEEIGASLPTCDVPFTLRLKRAELIATLAGTSQVDILTSITSEPDHEVILDEIVDEKDNRFEIGLNREGGPSLKTPKWKSTRTTQVKTRRADVDFDNVPSKTTKQRKFRIRPGKNSDGRLKGKPWSPTCSILLLKDQRDGRARILDTQHGNQPALSLIVRCKEKDWDFDFGDQNGGFFSKSTENSENVAAAKALIRKMLVDAGLHAGKLGDGTAYFDMDFFDARLP